MDQAKRRRKQVGRLASSALVAFVAAVAVLVAWHESPSTTTTSAGTFTYEARPMALAPGSATKVGPPGLRVALDGSSSRYADARGTSTTSSAGSVATEAAGGLPGNAAQALETIEQTGAAPTGYKGGSTFANDGRAAGQVLPTAEPGGGPITYQEWDVNPYPKGVNRGAERLVTGSDGSVYYTDDHYSTFTKVK